MPLTNILENVSLKPYNTFGVVAKTRYFATIKTINDLYTIVKLNQKTANSPYQPIMILGGGSNLLFAKNYQGLIIHNALKGMAKVKDATDYVLVKAYGGEIWNDLVQFCIHNNWSGIENLSLIPGCVGAAPIQNIGAYGVELKDVFYALEAMHLATGKLRTFYHNDCQFAYRESIFKKELKGQYCILSVTLQLPKKAKLKTNYGAIKQTIAQEGIKKPNIADIGRIVSAIRTQKLPNPKVLGNSGSFFKNPIISQKAFTQLQTQYPSLNIPNYPLSKKEIKIPAAWLIEQCGWKGKRVGDTGTYKNHALVLVNHGKASGKAIQQLSKDIQASVWQKFNIALQTEVTIL